MALIARSDGIYETEELIDEAETFPVETDVTDDQLVETPLRRLWTPSAGLTVW